MPDVPAVDMVYGTAYKLTRCHVLVLLPLTVVSCGQLVAAAMRRMQRCGTAALHVCADQTYKYVDAVHAHAGKALCVYAYTSICLSCMYAALAHPVC
jgi:hypothetical protein